ncbi:MAG: hypothetical protein KAR35_09955, partial [Candidatus Heimdallarchaeota archaeon]|nr:hypothetical protein [Candidatus Heimdallarchaeota archaeon]MCK5049679.1 hypothetical protein [Candidatus Heimdallarchaeota archaeon]
TITITSLSGEIVGLQPTSKVTFTTRPREILEWESTIISSDQNITIEITFTLDEGVPLNLSTSYLEVFNSENISIAIFSISQVNNTVFNSTIILNAKGVYWLHFSLETIDGSESLTIEYLNLDDSSSRTLGSFLSSIETELTPDAIPVLIGMCIFFIPARIFVFPKFKRVLKK